MLYHRTLNIGRVMSPTLALLIQREAEIDTFKPVPFYTVALELPGLTVSGERMADKAAAEQLKEPFVGDLCREFGRDRQGFVLRFVADDVYGQRFDARIFGV